MPTVHGALHSARFMTFFNFRSTDTFSTLIWSTMRFQKSS